MRMRRRRNLPQRMAACEDLWVQNPQLLRGCWRERMPQAREVHVEVGCGKGKFTVETAAAQPENLFIGIERVREALVIAMERAQERELSNVLFLDLDAACMTECFADNEVDRLYLNFSDPWPRKKNAKRRLTYHTFLEQYHKILRPEGEIHVKTDNNPLFEWSLQEFAAFGFPVRNVTRNLHEQGICGVMTDYEEKFYGMGTPINRCVVFMGEKRFSAT